VPGTRATRRTSSRRGACAMPGGAISEARLDGVEQDAPMAFCAADPSLAGTSARASRACEALREEVRSRAPASRRAGTAARSPMARLRVRAATAYANQRSRMGQRRARPILEDELHGLARGGRPESRPEQRVNVRRQREAPWLAGRRASHDQPGERGSQVASTGFPSRQARRKKPTGRIGATYPRPLAVLDVTCRR